MARQFEHWQIAAIRKKGCKDLSEFGLCRHGYAFQAVDGCEQCPANRTVRDKSAPRTKIRGEDVW